MEIGYEAADRILNDLSGEFSVVQGDLWRLYNIGPQRSKLGSFAADVLGHIAEVSHVYDAVAIDVCNSVEAGLVVLQPV